MDSVSKKNFFIVRANRWRLYVRRDFGQNPQAGEFLSGKYFDGIRGPFQEMAASKYAKVQRCCINFGGYKHTLYLKRYLTRSYWDFVKHIFRLSRARRAMNAEMLLKTNGLRCAETVALGEMMWGPVCVRNFLLTEDIQDANDIYQWMELFAGVDSGFSQNEKRKFVKKLGETIGQMHSAGIFHGDLRPGNILARRARESWEFFFLDNERTRKFEMLPWNLRLKNLVQINMLRSGDIGNTDRMRFFQSYLKQCRSIHNANQLARNVILRTARRMKHKPDTKTV